MVLRIKLDLAESKEKKLEVHREAVKAAERQLEFTQRHGEGPAWALEVLKVEAVLLDARIALERAKSQ